MVVITEEQFKDYERVRKSGETNMMNVPKVVELSDNLDYDDVKQIINNYDDLAERYK